MSGSFPSLKMFGFGRNSSFVIQEHIMQHFYVFQKIQQQQQSHLAPNKLGQARVETQHEPLVMVHGRQQLLSKHSCPNKDLLAWFRHVNNFFFTMTMKIDNLFWNIGSANTEHGLHILFLRIIMRLKIYNLKYNNLQ